MHDVSEPCFTTVFREVLVIILRLLATVSTMTANHLETGLEQTPETSSISNIGPNSDNGQFTT
jgi:hypothetical protein